MINEDKVEITFNEDEVSRMLQCSYISGFEMAIKYLNYHCNTDNFKEDVKDKMNNYMKNSSNYRKYMKGEKNAK